MNRFGIATSVLALSLVAAGGCASDPSKKVESAENQVNQSEMESAKKEGEQHVENRDKQAETTSGIQQSTAGTNKDAKLGEVNANANLEAAKVEMKRDREAFGVKAKTRFDQAEARASEAKVKAAKLTGKKKSDFQASLKGYLTARDEANNKVQGLPQVADPSWTDEKAKTETALDTFEKSVDQLQSRL
jgi:hypothetical protein